MKTIKIKKRYGALTLLLLIVISVLWALHDGKIGNDTGQPYTSLVLRNVDVIPMTGDTSELYPNQLVYIKNGIIDQIKPDSGQIVNADHSIDGNGKYLIPGLIDAHSHYFDVMDLPQTIAFGVTSVRVMNGFPMHLRWRNAILQGDIIGPTMVLEPQHLMPVMM